MAKIESVAVIAVTGLVAYIIFKLGGLKMPEMPSMPDFGSMIPAWNLVFSPQQTWGEGTADVQQAGQQRITDFELSPIIREAMEAEARRNRGVNVERTFTGGIGASAIDIGGRVRVDRFADIPNPQWGLTRVYEQGDGSVGLSTVRTSGYVKPDLLDVSYRSVVQPSQPMTLSSSQVAMRDAAIRSSGVSVHQQPAVTPFRGQTKPVFVMPSLTRTG